jgi:hypothetical protein
MTPATPRRNREEVARMGQEIYQQQVLPKLQQEDHGKFVAIDILTGEYEVDADDYTAVMRLRGRLPNAEMWLERAGHPTAYVLRRR